MPPASFMASDLLMDFSSLDPLPAQKTDLRTQSPDKAVSPGFEILLCHFLAVGLQFVSKMGRRITLRLPSQASCEISTIQWTLNLPQCCHHFGRLGGARSLVPRF